MKSSINYNYLECFFSLAKTLSFSKTSKELGIAQPAVSKKVKLLEEQFGSQLFLRTRQKVELSREGQKLYEQIWPLYREMNRRVEEFHQTRHNLEGKITFGCLEEVGEKVFIHALNLFKSKHPDIQFQVKFMKAFEIIEGVKNGSVDIGVVPNEIIQENIRTYEILEEEIILVTSKKNKDVAIEKITEVPMVTFRVNDPLLEFYLKKAYPKTQSNKLNIQFSVNSHKAMIDVIKKSNYYAVLPTLSIGKELSNGTLANVGPKSLKSKLYMIHLDHDYLDKKVVEFRGFLKSYVRERYE